HAEVPLILPKAVACVEADGRKPHEEGKYRPKSAKSTVGERARSPIGGIPARVFATATRAPRRNGLGGRMFGGEFLDDGAVGAVISLTACDQADQRVVQAHQLGDLAVHLPQLRLG